MQIFLLSSRSTASGNGIGSAPTAVRYKTSAGPVQVVDGAPSAPTAFSDDDGALAVRLARASVARALGSRDAGALPARLPAPFSRPTGVFVSWYRHIGHRLRGCVGFPRAVLPLGEGLGEAALSAALGDPRFPPITAAELPGLTVEVSLLTPAEPVARADLPGSVRVGVDGLEVERGRRRGLLLPQVAPEQGWDAAAFLDGACEKAGLPPGAWREEDVTVYRFGAEVFRESSPGGAVVRAVLGPVR